ncbi:hypothetical protein [Haloterrigena salinisoli]|uniref:hypothetical protein n=1 Tax=Haloterrigena salinisoli TaxID=3132747 RepID=UPI0030CD9B26
MLDVRAAVVQWLYLDGDRHVVAAALVIGVWIVLTGLGYGGILALDEPAAVRGIAGGLIPGLFTFLSIVLAINQLVLSQEFGSADEIRTRVEELREYRQDVEDAAETSPSPILPTEFLAVVVRSIESEAARLGDRATTDLDGDRRDSVVDFADAVAADARRADEILTRSGAGRVNAILSVLDYPYSRQLYEARRFRDDANAPPAIDEALADLAETLEFFSVARTHFRTTYTQRVLAQLSRRLLLVGVPALLATFAAGLIPLPVPSPLEGYGLVVVSGLFSIALAPFAVLFAYILRIATVSERTIAVGPFVSRPHEFESELAEEERAER